MAVLPDLLRRALCGVLFLGCSACTSPSLRDCGAIIRHYIVRDGRVVIEETARTLTTLDLNLQFEIYHCSARRMMPPLSGLRPVFASQGRAAGEFLVESIRHAPDDVTILSAVELLAEMKLQGTFDIAEDEVALAMISRQVQGMRDSSERTLARASLSLLANAAPHERPY